MGRRRQRRRARLAAMLVVAVLAALGYGEWRESTEEPAGVGAYRPGSVVVASVTRVVDGDTAVVRIGGREERVRYIGIDTPESVHPGRPVECFGKEASRRNAELVEGRRVRLVLGAEARDRYQRLLAYVYLGRLFVNAELLREGYAETLTIAPNDEFAGQFKRLERQARRAGAGLWGRC